MLKTLHIALFISLVVSVTLAQEKHKPPASLIGNFWVSTESSPAEQNDVVTYTHAEQGLTIWHSGRNSITPYIATDFAVDTKGKDWNNKALATAGVKLTRTLRRGLIEVKAGVAAEKRFKSGTFSAQPTASASYWLGWQAPQLGEHPIKYFTGYPGSSWAVFGNISPAEKQNLIGLVSLTQGVTLIDGGKWQVVPFVKAQSGFDTKGYDWNNKVLSSGGVKVMIPRSSGVLEMGVQYTGEHRQHLHSSGISAFVTLWTGWSKPVHQD